MRVEHSRPSSCTDIPMRKSGRCDMTAPEPHSAPASGIRERRTSPYTTTSMVGLKRSLCREADRVVTVAGTAVYSGHLPAPSVDRRLRRSRRLERRWRVTYWPSPRSVRAPPAQPFTCQLIEQKWKRRLEVGSYRSRASRLDTSSFPNTLRAMIIRWMCDVPS
jgi:hypothetical protein